MRKAVLYSLFVLNLLVVLGFWWGASGNTLGTDLANDIIVLGRLLGLLAVCCVLMQFVLIGRSVWVEQTFGLDRLTLAHHWNAFGVIFFILLHPIFITVGYALTRGNGIIAQFLNIVLTFDDALLAFIGALLFISVFCISLYIVRKRLRYETWYFIHLATYLAVAFAWFHQLELGEDFLGSNAFTYYWYFIYAVVFGNLLFWRFFRPLYRFYRHRFYVARMERETDSAVSIYISGRELNKFKVIPGQFMIVRFLTKGYWWEAHPFSLSMAPKNGELRLTIKAVGDFTSRVPHVPPGTKILIDGPYGVFTPKTAKHGKFLFLAGGIGITPIRSMLEGLGKESRGSALIYGNRTERDIVFYNELHKLSEANDFLVHHVMSEDHNFLGEKGKITLEMIKRLVPDFLGRDIYLCGPKPMMAGIRRELRAAGVPAGDIHFEKFSLH